MAPKFRVGRTALAITLILLFSRALGFVRDIVMAYVFGATNLTDDFVMAQSIVGVFSVLLVGALGTAYVPIYSEVLGERNGKTGSRFVNTVYTVAPLAVILMGIGVAVFPRPLVALFAPSFSATDADLTARLLVALVPSMLFALFVTLDTATLQVNGSFLAAAAIGFPSNVVLILGMLLATESLGIYSLALSTCVGVAAQALLLWIVKRRRGLRTRPGFALRDESVRRIGTLIGPVLLGTGMVQIVTFVDRALASGLPEGSIAALAFSNKIALFVQQLVSASVVSVFYASMSSLSASGEEKAFREQLRGTIGAVLVLLVPSSAGLIALRHPLVQIIYEHGAFDAIATDMTATALLFYAIGLAAFSVRELISRALYAKKDTKTTMLNGIWAVALNVALALLLVPRMGIGGLALASSAAGIFGCVTLGWRLYRKIGDFGLASIGIAFLKVLAASAVMALTAVGVHALGTTWTGSDVAATITAVIVAVPVYLVMAWALRVDDVRRLWNLVASRLHRQSPAPDPLPDEHPPWS